MDDLIKRLKGFRDTQWNGDDYLSPVDRDLLDETIEALKPVEDAELERMIFHIGDVENYLTADERNHYVSLIERLVRENAELEKRHAGAMQYADGQKIDIEGLQAKVEELEERERVLLHNMNAIHQNITWIARLSEPVRPPQEDD